MKMIPACLALLSATLAAGCAIEYEYEPRELTIALEPVFASVTSDDALLFLGSVYGAGPALTVDWRNESSGLEGTASVNPSYGFVSWAAVVPLAPGENVIVFTANEPGLAPDAAIVVITRDPLAPPAH